MRMMALETGSSQDQTMRLSGELGLHLMVRVEERVETKSVGNPHDSHKWRNWTWDQAGTEVRPTAHLNIILNLQVQYFDWMQGQPDNFQSEKSVPHPLHPNIRNC